jgi:shikimate kinase
MADSPEYPSSNFPQPDPAAPGSFDHWPSRIYLLGFMGSGKSALGRKLARYVGYGFVDLDDLIVANAGMDIPAIFDASGEAHFRTLEAETLRETVSLQRHIIALGGGTPCFGENMDWVNTNGHSVYLRLPVEVLFGRLRKKKAGRPLIASMEDDELRAFIEGKVSERSVYYTMARQILDVLGMNARQVAEALSNP